MKDACMEAKSASRSFLFAIDTLADGTPARLKVFVGAVQMKDFPQHFHRSKRKRCAAGPST